ncbi:NAD-dependent epimerase/dehydratase family protein [Massilia forsythiae]|uniref:NAD-dependent epimerase/dehydratase family protein n=1 Tax=Massilia forsythiae TaxID=2728020 RepID=A0A7Z2VZR1_9BURK|nr:hopanoid-associated sugar epimerase [Massilia forsythiae]QJE01835.1 NAD-dependent epimerase/dehydratase family protein [Massilia forsythiae]
MADLVLVTGAAGFVGSAVARAALERGYRVRLLVRAGSPRRNLAGLDAEVAVADMRDQPAVERALDGARYLLHVAADYRLWSRTPGDIVGNNVTGTAAVMRAALATAVERVVYTSSVATLRVAPSTVAAAEDAPVAPDAAIGAYKRSKVLAERLVERMAAEEDLPAVIVNPSTPVGPRDVRPTPTGRIIVEAARGRMPAFVETGLNVVGVDDVARGHLLALERGRVGERYILGGDNLMLHQLLAEIAALCGRRAPRIRLPVTPLLPLAHLAQAAARLSGREPLLTVDGLRMSRNRMFFSSDKAQRELGYRPAPHAAAVQAALAWFGQAGYLGRRRPG